MGEKAIERRQAQVDAATERRDRAKTVVDGFSEEQIAAEAAA